MISSHTGYNIPDKFLNDQKLQKRFNSSKCSGKYIVNAIINVLMTHDGCGEVTAVCCNSQNADWELQQKYFCTTKYSLPSLI